MNANTNWQINWHDPASGLGQTRGGSSGSPDNFAPVATPAPSAGGLDKGEKIALGAILGVGAAVVVAEAALGGYAGCHGAKRLGAPCWTGAVVGAVAIPGILHGVLRALR